MTSAELTVLLGRLGAAATDGDVPGFAGCFTEDAVYHDYIYGDHTGRAGIAEMLEQLFHRDAEAYDWRFFDAVCDGSLGYARSLSRFVSKVPEFAGRPVVIDGISRFVLQDGLIADYSESVNGGVAMVQLGVAPLRMAKVLQRWANALQTRPDVVAYVGT